MTTKAEAIMSKIAAFTEAGAKKEEAEARIWGNQAKEIRGNPNMTKLDLLKQRKTHHATWAAEDAAIAKEHPIVDKMLLGPVKRKLMAGGQKFQANRIARLEANGKGNKKLNPVFKALEEASAGMLARRMAYASERQGAGNLKRIWPAVLNRESIRARERIMAKKPFGER